MNVRSTVILLLVVHAGVAEARFGKKDSGGVVGSNSTASSSNSGSDTHAAVPVDSPGSSSGASSSAPAPTSRRGSLISYFEPRSWTHGFYSGAYVPVFGYGYAYPTQVNEPEPALEPAELRVTANAEVGVFVNEQRGYTLGVNAMFEGENFGVATNFQNIAVAADDGSSETDNLKQLTGRLTYAFLTGKYGRLRAEFGGDIIWAPDVVVLGASLGLSGTVWIVGSLAFEGSAWATVYPFWQLDARAGLVYGLGPVGFRVGFRGQVLDDRGIVDGQIHRDVFLGPYAGVGFAF